MKRYFPCMVVSLLVGWLSLGCALQPTARNLKGEWKFAYAKNAMAPPRFDVIKFNDDKAIQLTASLNHQSFKGEYTLTDKAIRWKFQPKELAKPVEHTLEASLKSMGLELVLRAEGSEFTYLNPQLLLTDDLAGHWRSEGKDGTEMVLDKQEGYSLDGGKVAGVYRLWRSNAGKMMTTIVWIPDEGAFTIYWLYNRKGDRLTLTPVGPQGPDKASQVQWKLVK